MDEITAETAPFLQPPLDSETLRGLISHWNGGAPIPSGWKPRRRLESFVAEAFRLAALIEESGTALLPREEAVVLREMGLAASALDNEAHRVRADHARAEQARTTRREARFFMSEVLGALHYLARTGLEGLDTQLAIVRRHQQADDLLAAEMDLVREIARANQLFLTPLGISREFVQNGHRLSATLRQISAERTREIRARSQATDARNRVLLALSKRISDLSSTLRYAHRGDRAWLARIARPAKKTRRGRG